jgi:N-ethylmaleimide reductase
MPDKSGNQLFTPVTLGRLQLPNRVLMASMTRRRARENGCATSLMAHHYAERASAGLIIAEASWISPEGVGDTATPGIFRACHVEAWRAVTAAVHAAGGRIALQLSHVGRISHPLVQPGGGHPVAPSSIAAAGQIRTPAGLRAYPVPRALLAEELPRIVTDFADAAERAIAAGFDAFEIHAASGYLLDQFLRSSTNRRQDAHGGTPENRARLVVQVATAVAARIGADRVGLRISPQSPHNDIHDASPRETFTVLAQLLRPLRLAWLHLVEPVPELRDGRAQPLAATLRAAFDGPVILAGGHDQASADAALAAGEGDAIAFGRPFIANPDLPERLLAGAPLAQPDPATIQAGGAEGYVGHPRWQANIAA